MASSAGDFDGALGRLLPAHILEINQKFLIFPQQSIAIGFQGSDSVARIHEVDYIQQRTHWINIDPADHGGLAGVCLRNHKAGDLAAAGLERDRQRPPDAANTTVER